ncbi:inositol monophosphatase family protein [Chelativorans salis]|uniref:Inositol monophosphatase n=1 Tax=Chelativorans salis TaxID=2978478 RepID=A0ABT2LKT9_9HYPH|nr:inositol monophosphatase [Chelativorans sp. EGI FJ00035]MCT7375180.1 inositol monophosphatase [Chelativorans sp. EGI FJ00035]
MRFDENEIEWLADLMAQSAAAEIMPRFRKLEGEGIRHKTSPIDLVTEADVNAELVIARELRARYPGALVVGEEACADNPSILAGLQEAQFAFTIDPVDGTFNFASGLPLFGVMLAVVKNGEAVAGIIHDPVGGDWLIGVKGAGSHMRTAEGAETRLRVAEPAAVSSMSGSISWQYLAEPERSRLARNHARCRSAIGYRCAAHEYRLLAAGHVHFAVYAKLMPWDHLPGTLIHGEAGGYAARFDGSAYRPFHTDGGLLVAPDPESWRILRNELWTEA